MNKKRTMFKKLDINFDNPAKQLNYKSSVYSKNYLRQLKQRINKRYANRKGTTNN